MNNLNNIKERERLEQKNQEQRQDVKIFDKMTNDTLQSQVSILWNDMTRIDVKPEKGVFLGLRNWNKISGMGKMVRIFIILLILAALLTSIGFLIVSSSKQTDDGSGWSAAFVLMTVFVVVITMIITHWMNKKFAELMIEKYKFFQKGVYHDLVNCQERMKKNIEEMNRSISNPNDLAHATFLKASSLEREEPRSGRPGE